MGDGCRFISHFAAGMNIIAKIVILKTRAMDFDSLSPNLYLVELSTFLVIGRQSLGPRTNIYLTNI